MKKNKINQTTINLDSESMYFFNKIKSYIFTNESNLDVVKQKLFNFNLINTFLQYFNNLDIDYKKNMVYKPMNFIYENPYKLNVKIDIELLNSHKDYLITNQIVKNIKTNELIKSIIIDYYTNNLKL